MKNVSQKNLQNTIELSDKVSNLQIQMDRLDSKMVELRDEQMRQNIDPKPLIVE